MRRRISTEITSQNVYTAFINIWVSRFRVPLHVITDRGIQLESELFSELSYIENNFVPFPDKRLVE